LLFSIATTALAQPTPPATIGSVPPVQLEELPGIDTAQGRMPDPTDGLIRVDVAVTDKAGKPVPGLLEKDFSLVDNDRQQKIVTFQAFNGGIQPASSLEVVLVIDGLNMLANAQTGKKEISEASREVETFLRANGGVLEHPTILYRLTADGLFATPHASTDGNELADEIEKGGRQRRIWSPPEIARDVGKISKGDKVSSRITTSIVALGSIAIEERRRPGRKLLFWIGNGWPIANRKATGLSDFSIELLTRMREARINLWGVSEWPLYDSSGNAVPVADYFYKEFLKGPQPDSTDLGYLALPVIAARSGGGTLNTENNLASLIREHVREGRVYYSLTFDPPRTEVVDEYHHLKLETDQPDLTVHLFQDYYDEPVFYDQPPATQLISVKQLEALLANAHDAPGADLAHQLDGMELNERLGSTKLAALAKSVHGKKLREALEVLADESVFLAPPSDEISPTPPPDLATQRQIISRTIFYINTAIPSLPDFFATRATVQYHAAPPNTGETWKTAWSDQFLHEGETATARIHFHDGKEWVEDESVTGSQFRMAIPHLRSEPVKNAADQPGSQQLRTIGTFGPILVSVMTAATLPHSELKWTRWEESENGRLAVFRYRVPEETRLFTAEFCCLANDFEAVPFKKAAPFHGEIAVDPSTGAILRLTIQADLEWRLPLERSDVMVEYRPVRKGARTFICPARSVSISRQRRTMTVDEWGEGFKVYAPFETLLNEMRFEKYRIFGSTSRMLPGFTEVPEVK
jgi:VWFA-related protein